MRRSRELKDTDLTRREFVAASGAGLVGTLALAAGPIALLAPSRTWALALERLDPHTGETLIHVTRHIYPHDSLENAVYALVVKALDAEAAANDGTATLLSEGVAELDLAGDKRFLELDAPEQRRAVEERAGTAFFEKVRSTAVVALYNNDMAFAHFGYEGSSFDKGGYLTRGFNDLDWLPDPPVAASPSV